MREHLGILIDARPRDRKPGAVSRSRPALHSLRHARRARIEAVVRHVARGRRAVREKPAEHELLRLREVQALGNGPPPLVAGALVRIRIDHNQLWLWIADVLRRAQAHLPVRALRSAAALGDANGPRLRPAIPRHPESRISVGHSLERGVNHAAAPDGHQHACRLALRCAPLVTLHIRR